MCKLYCCRLFALSAASTPSPSLSNRHLVCFLPDADGGDIESMPEEKQEQFQEMRCGSMGRGSVYDSVAGECC